MNIKRYEKIAREIRKKIVVMHKRSRTSHIGSALSCVDILVVLYFKILNIDPKNPEAENRDRFILSKGHACSALYATLAMKKFFSEKILDKYGVDDGILFGHVTKGLVPGVEASTGSLGHGLSLGIGMAIAGRYDKKNYRVFVLMSDGECDEGSVWEGALFASHHKLDNLIAIIDYNKLQAFGRTNEIINLEPIGEKWKAFGWSVKVVDGHALDQLITTFEKIPFERGKPNLIVAHTIKGKGISFMENRLEWHYKSPNELELTEALKELDTK
ncbi:MAG: transketolase [Candidatus Omnitrophica bacterium]|nr:transketolase [Candidatus Omnitrophota bacterium]